MKKITAEKEVKLMNQERALGRMLSDTYTSISNLTTFIEKCCYTLKAYNEEDNDAVELDKLIHEIYNASGNFHSYVNDLERKANIRYGTLCSSELILHDNKDKLTSIPSPNCARFEDDGCCSELIDGEDILSIVNTLVKKDESLCDLKFYFVDDNVKSFFTKFAKEKGWKYIYFIGGWQALISTRKIDEREIIKLEGTTFSRDEVKKFIKAAYLKGKYTREDNLLHKKTKTEYGYSPYIHSSMDVKSEELDTEKPSDCDDE